MNKYFLVLVMFFLTLPAFGGELVRDEIVDTMLTGQTFEKPQANLDYNYQDTDSVEIKLSIVDPIKSEKAVYETQPVKFRVVSDVRYKGRVVIKKNTIVPALVGLIISSGMNGIPASIIFTDFEFENIDKNLISDTYEVRGQDRSLLVFPLKWALTILPPSGSLTNFIKGGHAKLKTDKVIKIYYYPNWAKNKEQGKI